MKLLTPIYRRLFGYLRPYLFPYVSVMLIAMVVLSSSEGTIVLIIKRFTNSLTVSRNLTALPFLSLLLLGFSSFAQSPLSAPIISMRTSSRKPRLICAAA